LASLAKISTSSCPLVPIRPQFAHQAHGPEQIPLDHEGVKAPDALLRVDPVQHKMVLDWGAEIVRHRTAQPLSE
jgi:hypothetical protein